MCANNIIITSNLHPKDWWKDLDEVTLAAFLRRVTITHFDRPFQRMVERMGEVLGYDGVGPNGTQMLM